MAKDHYKAIINSRDDIDRSRAIVSTVWHALNSTTLDQETDLSDLADTLYEAVVKLNGICGHINSAIQSENDALYGGAAQRQKAVTK